MIAKKKKTGRDLAILSLLVLLLAIPLYYWFLHSDKEIDNGLCRLQPTITSHKEPVWVAKFSPRGNIIASAGVDSTVYLHATGGATIAELKHPVPLTNLAFSRDGSQLVTTAYDGKLRLWDVAGKKLVAAWQAHEGTVWTVAWHPQANIIATAGEDKLVKLWDAQTFKLLGSYSGHERNVWAVTFTATGDTIISSGFDTHIKLWQTQSGKLLHTLEAHDEAVVSLAVNAGGTLLASGSDDGDIKLWNLRNLQPVKTLGTGLRHVYGLDFSPDGTMLLSGHLDKPAIGEVLQNFFGNTHHNKGVTARLWQVNTGKPLQTMSGHGNDVNDVSWSADGKYFVTAGEDKQVQVWKMME